MGILDFLGGGAGGILGNAPRSLFGPSPYTAEAERQGRTQASVYQALKAAGVPDATAAAGALSPDVLKTISPAYFDTAPKLQETTNNPLTGEKGFSIYEPAKKTLTPIGPSGPLTEGQATPTGSIQKLFDKIDTMRQSGASFEDMLKEVPTSFRGYIQGLNEGRALPGNLGRSSTARQTVMSLAQSMGLDEGAIKARMQFFQDLGNTKSGLGFRLEAAKKMLGHMEGLTNNILKQDNFDVPSGAAGYIPGVGLATEVLNARKNSPAEQRSLANEIKTVAETFSQEKGRFLGGVTGGTQAERLKTVEAYNPNAPKSALAGTLQGDMDLFNGQFAGMNSQRDTLLGPNFDHPRAAIVSPEMQAQMKRIQDKIDKIRGGTPSAAAPQQGAFTPPAGWQFSKSRNQFRDTTGKIYDINGKPL